MYREGRDSLFLRSFGKSPQTRIIDLFLDNPLYEFTRNEIMAAIGMSKITISRTLPIIEEIGIISVTRKIGKAKLYRLNQDSNAVNYFRAIIREYSEKIALQELGVDPLTINEG